MGNLKNAEAQAHSREVKTIGLGHGRAAGSPLEDSKVGQG